MNVLQSQPQMAPEVISVLRSPTTARRDILRAVDEARSAADLRPYELADLAGLEQPNALDDIENAKLTFGDVLSLTAVLGVAHDRILPLLPLTPEKKEYWEKRMNGVVAGPVASSDGEIPLDPEISLELFIRFEALKEVFKS